MKILITGGSGQLGQAFLRIINSEHELLIVPRSSFDLGNPEQMEALMLKSDLDAVINCAAYTNVELAESEPQAAFQTNEIGADLLAKICAKHDIHLLHLSTDYVFDGKNTQAYLESEPVTPINVYGESKAAGEKAILNAHPKALIVRVSWLYDFVGKNFLNTMRNLAKTREHLQVVNDQVSSPVYAGILAQDLLDILQQSIEKSISGVFHYRHAGRASWFEFAKAIFEVYDLEVNVQAVSSESFPTKAKRPSFSLLSTDKLRRTFSLPNYTWQQALERCCEDEKNHE
jgi:dTDP-4-dehydrorhamnose reductase